MTSLDKIILGHNQFFGTDHLSSERGAARASHFNNIDNVVNIIRYAFDSGATGLMLSTHENARLIIDKLSEDPVLSRHLNLYVLLPYMAKYVRKANERGIVNIAGDILGEASWSNRIELLATGSSGILKGDLITMLKMIIDIELLPFRKLNIKSIVLHNSLSDMIASLRLTKVVEFFYDYIKTKYEVRPAFCTLNTPILINFLTEIGIVNPTIMAPLNPIGFQMNPSKSVVENTLKHNPTQLIAMSTLASGYIKPTKHTNIYLRCHTSIQ